MSKAKGGHDVGFGLVAVVLAFALVGPFFLIHTHLHSVWATVGGLAITAVVWGLFGMAVGDEKAARRVTRILEEKYQHLKDAAAVAEDES